MAISPSSFENLPITVLHKVINGPNDCMYGTHVALDWRDPFRPETDLAQPSRTCFARQLSIHSRQL